MDNYNINEMAGAVSAPGNEKVTTGLTARIKVLQALCFIACLLSQMALVGCTSGKNEQTGTAGTLAATTDGEDQLLGTVLLSGQLDQKTDFTLHLSYLAVAKQGVLRGITVYHRENGKDSEIQVYGQWNPATGEVLAYEMNHDKVCGHFAFNMPREALQQDKVPVQGRWYLGSREMKFTGVQLTNATLQSENYLVARQADEAANGGAYGMCWKSERNASLQNCRILDVDLKPDSTIFSLGQEVDEDYLRHQFCSDAGYASGKDCWAFTLGSIHYGCLALADVIVIYETGRDGNDGNGLPQGMEVTGVYKHLTTSASAAETRHEGEAEMTYSVDICVPYVEDKDLAGHIHDFVTKELGGEAGDSYQQIANKAAKTGVEGLETWEDMEPWQAPWSSKTVVCQPFNNGRNYINLFASGTDYMGGAHGMPYRRCYTLDRQTGHVMTYADWFDAPMEKLEPLVAKALREQVDTENFETIVLPANDPWVEEDGMHFLWTVYEIAPYCEGFPECVVSTKDILPLLSAYGKKIMK